MTKLISPTNFRYDPEAHKYFVDDVEYPSITKLINIDTTWFKPGSGERGRLVHKATALWETMGAHPKDPLIASYLEGWKLFVKEWGWVSNIIEQPMLSEKYRFAGTPDRAGYTAADKWPCVCEIKSGSAQLVNLQTVAQNLLIDESPMNRLVVQITKDGQYKAKYISPAQWQSDKEIFLSKVEDYWRNKK